MVDSLFYPIDTSLLIALFLFFVTGSLALALGAFSNARKAEVALEKRLASSSVGAQSEKAVSQDILTKSRSVHKKKVRNWMRSKNRMAIVVMAMGSLFLWPFIGHPLFLGLLFIGATGGILYYQGLRARRRKKLLSDQFPEALDLMVRGGRVGVSAEENMRNVARELPQPLAGIFNSVSEKIDIGLPFEQVLTDMARKLDLREFRYMAITLTIQRRTGGRYVDVLENLSQILREHQEQSRKTEAATSEARLASKIVSFLVVLSCGLLFFLNRDQFDFFLYDATGQQLLIYSGLSVGAGFLVMHQMLERFK